MTRPGVDEPIDVLMALNYYTPYVSGLTNVARDVAEHLAGQGKRVTVLTTQHSPDLARFESVNGVRVFRTKVVGRVDRAPISPTFVGQAIRLSRHSGVVNLHLPMPEAGAIALGLRRGTPLVLTYQCDPPSGLGMKSDVVRTALDLSHRIALRKAAAVVVSSIDYAQSSRVLKRFEQAKIVEIPPPSWPRARGLPQFRQGAGRHIGFLGRLTSEKGVDLLVRAFRSSADDADRLLIAGEGLLLAGASALTDIRRAAQGDPRVVFLGRISDDQIADFYESIDVFCVPSTNSFEAFGIVQVEAMLAGVPVVAADLPGVRTVVQSTGGGLCFETGDVRSLADALTQVRDLELDRDALAAVATQRYGVAESLNQYSLLLDDLDNR